MRKLKRKERLCIIVSSETDARKKSTVVSITRRALVIVICTAAVIILVCASFAVASVL